MFFRGFNPTEKCYSIPVNVLKYKRNIAILIYKRGNERTGIAISSVYVIYV